MTTILSQILANEVQLLQDDQTVELTILSAIQKLAADSDAKQAQVVNFLQQILDQFGPTRVPTSLKVGIPRFVNRTTGEVMPGPYSVTNNHDLELDLIWADNVGPVAPLPGGTTVTSDTLTVIAGGTVSANDAKTVLQVVPGATGTANVTWANPGAGGGAPALTVTEVINVGVPIPTSLSTANPVAVPHGTAPG